MSVPNTVSSNVTSFRPNSSCNVESTTAHSPRISARYVVAHSRRNAASPRGPGRPVCATTYSSMSTILRCTGRLRAEAMVEASEESVTAQPPERRSV